jgi:glutathione S-transferase
MRVYRIPYSTNVERVALAAAHKGLAVEWIDVPADDRSAVVAASGQPLVPVLVDGELVLHDSPVILRWLEERHPEPPLLPEDAARRAEVETFVDWFNLVWKRAPNLMVEELARPHPDLALVEAWGTAVTAALDRFEALLAGRSFLYGDELGMADIVAFPFLKYATRWEEGDDEPFHWILRDWQRAGAHPRLRAWIDRVDALPRA